MNNINHTALIKETIRILSISLITIIFALFNIYVAKITSQPTAILASLFILVSIRSVYLASTHYYKFYNHEVNNSKMPTTQRITDDIRYKNNQRLDLDNNSHQPQSQPKNNNSHQPQSQPKNNNSHQPQSQPKNNNSHQSQNQFKNNNSHQPQSHNQVHNQTQIESNQNSNSENK
jgi:hypothetical protein